MANTKGSGTGKSGYYKGKTGYGKSAGNPTPTKIKGETLIKGKAKSGVTGVGGA